MDTAEVVSMYVQVWHERDETIRRRLLEQTWAEDGAYTDPGGTIAGREALVEAIADFHQNQPDVRIEFRSGIDEFGSWPTPPRHRLHALEHHSVGERRECLEIVLVAGEDCSSWLGSCHDERVHRRSSPSPRS